MATGLYSWSQTAATNATADSTITFSEGQTPASLNDSCRAVMAVIAQARDDWAGVTTSNGVMTTGGDGSALTVVSNISIGALTNGWTVTFRISTGDSNTGTVTLNVDGTGAKQLRSVTGTALPAGYLMVGGIYTATYYQPLDQWILHGAYGRKVAIPFIIDGGGSAITTGIKGDLEIPFACTIQAARAAADQSGSIVVDIWKDTYANYPPTDADTITASAPVTISTATKSEDTTLTGWTTTITAGDFLRFNVDSATTVTRVLVSLTAVTTV
jgi:hypothetical protein